MFTRSVLTAPYKKSDARNSLTSKRKPSGLERLSYRLFLSHGSLGTPGGEGVRQKREVLIVTRPRTAAFTRRKKALDLREQAIRKMALVDETVGTVAAALVGKREAVEFRKDDHPQVRTGEADLLCSLQPVNPRHAEIEENQIGLVDGCKVYSMQAVTGGPNDLKPSGEFEIVPHGAKRRGGIVGNKNANGFHSLLNRYESMMKESRGRGN
jgi:hypothetical protein